MSNSKDFKNLNDQISILSNRGLRINDYEKCKQYLLTNNYYNIINGYSKFFQKNDNDIYIDNVTFDEVCDLYLFDNEIKQTIFRAILNVEHHLKSIFAYRFAEAYPNKRYSYLDINCYSSDKALDVGYIISKLSMIINKHKRYPNNAINHYVKKYNDVPIWVIIDFLDFGELVSLINCVPRSLQNKIAKDLVSFIKDNVPDFNKQFTPETMISLIKNIRETRNVCAHNNRLLDFRCRSDSIFFPAIHGSSGIHKDEMRRELYSTFVSMQCFLSKTEFAILNNTLRKKFRHLANKIKSIDINNILDSLGFPHDWYQKEKILQF